MRILYLELRNYRRFKQLKLQFPDGIVGILGLNGAGKSTVIESIAWALFGNVDEVVRTTRDNVKRAGAGPQENCEAILEFELGGSEYRLERMMGGKNLSMKAELRTKSKILAEGDKPVRKMVEKLMGMDHKSFFTSVFARQKELNALQNVAAGERKKVVLRMLRIDGIDTVLADIRADKRNVLARIEGAQHTLLAEDGREREKVLGERIPELTTTLEASKKDFDIAERSEQLAAKEADVVRKKRDELKKDVDAYTSSSSELKAKQSALKELAKREEHIQEKISSTESRLKRLPELEREDAEFKRISEAKDNLEKLRTKHEKARAIEDEIQRDEAESARRKAEVTRLKDGLGKLSSLEEQLADVEKAKTECETSRNEISGRIGELRAKSSQLKEAAEKDSNKLTEIKSAGKKGTCPTCERTLEEAFDLLVEKLTESSAQAKMQAKDVDEAISKLLTDLEGLTRREDAVKKKRTRLEQDLRALKQQEASLSEKEMELAKCVGRIGERRMSLSELGEVRFDEEEFQKVRKEHERLKTVHDDFTKLRSLKEQNEQNVRDLAGVRESIKIRKAEEETYAGIVKTLEPKKGEYDFTIKELDEKTFKLNQAKDALRKQGTLRDKAQSELDASRKQLEEIARVKKTIENDRKEADDLALLEDVVVNFKDNLIGRIAPTLSELTSRSIEAMTEGRYSKVVLDENYEMMIEDQGAMYPVSRFSGGESDLANLSLRLAISSIIADRTGAAPINILILDEIFGSQDLNRKRSVMTALSRLSAQFRQIFLITHIEDVKESMNYVIKVEESEDGTSEAALIT
jgi:DNA repair protein SbcC/Rad50